MKMYERKEPSFSLCGLNCALCPRFHTEGSSKCPGCGGTDFYLKHPTCAVITCSKKHGDVEYCFECSEYPCKKYAKPSETDSFISYQNVLLNMERAKADLPMYLEELKAKQSMLECLIAKYNDGRSKGFYCIAANLLPLNVLNEAMDTVNKSTDFETASPKEIAKKTKELLKSKAAELGIELNLRKTSE